MSTPRVFGIPATGAPVVAMIRRGPSDWVHIGRWELDTDRYVPGAWMRGTIYPQKCDLSPDGRWLVYSAMKLPGDWPAGPVYEAVSRLPWLTALAAWGSGTTYTRGLHFTTETSDVGPPDVGDAAPLLKRRSLRWTAPIQFAVERRRGWTESDDTSPREDGGSWDEARAVAIVKRQPTGVWELRVEGRYAAFRAGDPGDGPPLYSCSDKDRVLVLDDVQWADWDSTGDLIVATTAGLLERRNLTTGVRNSVVDLGKLKPEPRPAPDWAAAW